MIRKYIIGFFLVLLSSACKDNQNIPPIKTSFGVIYSKSIKSGTIEKGCLSREIATLLSDIDQGKIDPYRNKVYKEHPIVEEITKNAHIDVKRDAGYQNVLIPIDKNNLKIILYQNNNYALYGLSNNDFQINLEKCFQ